MGWASLGQFPAGESLGWQEGGRLGSHPESRAVQSRLGPPTSSRDPSAGPGPGPGYSASGGWILEGGERSRAWEGFHLPQSCLWGAGPKGGREVGGWCLTVLESCNLF